MNYKLIAILVFLCTVIYNAWIKYLEYRSGSNPLPENVKHVYDQEKYKTYKAYHRANSKLSLMEFLVSNGLVLILLLTNAYAHLSAFAGTNIYTSSCAVVIISILIETVISIPFDYVDTMKIEQKFEFNRTTKKTFIVDIIKNLVIGIGVACGLTCLFAKLYTSLGNGFLLVFMIIIFALIVVLSLLAPVLVRIFNKLTPLEDGELRQKLELMLQENGYKVKQISVMDGSKRSTKANAFFGGFGKFKTIVLYDTLIEQLETDEIVAVFAHEMGHGKHKDTLKSTLINLISILIITLSLWVLVVIPEFSTSFGFEDVNYGFVFLLASSTLISFASPFVDLLFSTMTRKFEYRADREAVKEGYGKALEEALIKLSRNSLSDLSPDPLLVKLTYSHPTLSQRIEAIDKAIEQK